jgi:acetyl-CoA carboxylase beta subunit
MNNDDLNAMSFMEPQLGEKVKCAHCWNTVTRNDIAENDSACPRCDRYLDMDESPYVND